MAELIDFTGPADDDAWYREYPPATNLPDLLQRKLGLDDETMDGMRRAFSHDYRRTVATVAAMRAALQHFGTGREATVGLYMNCMLNFERLSAEGHDVDPWEVQRLLAVALVILARTQVLRGITLD